MKTLLERNKEVVGRKYMSNVAGAITHEQRMRYILTGQYMTDKEAHEQFFREFYAGYKRK